MRDVYLGVEPAVDVSGFDGTRFSRGASRGEVNIV